MADYYDTGTVTVTAGSRTFTGTGTSWAGLIRGGDTLEIGGRQMRVASVESGNSGTLKLPAPAAASGAYAIWYEAPSRTAVMQVLDDTRRLIEASEILSPMRAEYEVQSATLNAPPAAPVTSDMYLISTAPTGGWAGRAGHLAQWTGTGWAYTAPQFGMRAVARDTGRRWARSLTAWALSPDLVSSLGVSGSLLDATGILPDANLPTRLASSNAVASAVLNSFGQYSAVGGYDANSIAPGERGLYSASSGLNFPLNNGFWYVECSLTYVRSAMQIAVRYAATGAAPPVVYVRTRSNDEIWGAWIMVTSEYGSNANGEWFRFGNGLQICSNSTLSITNFTGSSRVFQSDPVNWTFPVAFSTQPTVSTVTTSSNCWTATASSTVSCSVSGFLAFALATPVGLRAVAIGRYS